MPAPQHDTGHRDPVRTIVVVTISYAVLSLYVRLLADLAETGPIFWPAAGVAVAGLLMLRTGSWPWLIAAVVATQLVIDLGAGQPALAAGTWATANAIGHTIAAALIRHWRCATLHTAPRVLLFGVGAAAGAIPASIIGAFGIVTTDPALSTAYDFWLASLAWAAGDALGVVVITPVVFVITGHLGWWHDRRAEGVAILAAVVATSLFVSLASHNEIASALTYMLLLPMAWAATRLRVAGAAVSVTIMAIILLSTTAIGFGPFVTVPMGANLAVLNVKLFVGAVALITYLLASQTAERHIQTSRVEDRDLLLAAVSHELRTPLTPIVGFSELLLERDRDLDTQARHQLEIVHRNGRHLTRLIDDLLLFTRAYDDKLEPEADEIAVEEFVRDLLAERDQHVELSTASELHGAKVLADPSHVTQIVSNLLDNAAKYGRPPVAVEVFGDEDEVRIAVTDNGDGVPQWFVTQMFDVFSQATLDDRRTAQGLGLGLSISRNLAKANGGDLAYDPDHGSGARFVLSLPRLSPPRDQAGTAAASV